MVSQHQIGFKMQDVGQGNWKLNNKQYHGKVYDNIVNLQKVFKKREWKSKNKVYLSLHWSTRAIAIYLPDKINRDTSSWLNDLHCKRK